MKCSDLENTLALYAGGDAPAEAEPSLAAHLTACPLCRQKKEDYADIRRELRQFAAPQLPAAARETLKANLRREVLRGEPRGYRISRDLAEWLQMHLMPYSVGVAVSLVVGFGMLTAMFSGREIPAGETASVRPGRSAVPLATDRRSDPFDLTAADIAGSRMQFARESPSINPKGALVALTKSLVRGEMKDEEVVVVADVFSNGLAKISEVVESPEDRTIIRELEKALTNDPSAAPFVPTVLEHRPEHVQIVLKLQSVDVPTGLKPARRRS